MAKAAKPILNKSSALLTLTYLGAVQTLPNYNVMGLAKASLEANTRFLAASMGQDDIRVNAISAGPIKTLAASGVKNFRKMLSQHSSRAPLGRTVTTEEVGNAAAFLCSDLASGITGEITYVDAGFNTAAMPLNEFSENL
jgi:enoyl-[acyl-carrier protein] reductase I